MSALVLGGGGVTGIAWMTGLLFGLADHGADLTDADLVVGTSAGAAVGAQVTTGRSLRELYERQLDDRHHELAVELGIEALMKVFGEVGTGDWPDAAGRARVGAVAALATPTVAEPTRRAVIEARLETDVWPDRDMRITAVDAETGVLRVFDRHDGVGLIDAVAASCAVPAVWPPVTIAGRRYVDGGVRSLTNADLAAGHDPIVVIVPRPDYGQAAVQREVDHLREGATAVLVQADDVAVAAMGMNPLDPAMRPPAAEAGRRQAASVADEIAAAWR